MRLFQTLNGLLLTCCLLPSAAALAAAAPPKLSVVATIPGPDGGWDTASVDAVARRLYVAHGDAVMAVDLDSGKVTPALVAGKRLHAVVPLADGRALSTNGGDNTATLFETATGKVIAAIPTGLNPDVAVFDPSSGLVLVMDGRADGEITLIDPKTASSPGKIAVGGKLEFAVADGHGTAYVNVEDKGEIAVVDIAGRKVTARYKLPDCDEPSGLALNPAGGLLVAACQNVGEITPICCGQGGAVKKLVPVCRHNETIAGMEIQRKNDQAHVNSP